jgi:hypothetical protein
MLALLFLPIISTPDFRTSLAVRIFLIISVWEENTLAYKYKLRTLRTLKHISKHSGPHSVPKQGWIWAPSSPSSEASGGWVLGGGGWEGCWSPFKKPLIQKRVPVPVYWKGSYNRRGRIWKEDYAEFERFPCIQVPLLASLTIIIYGFEQETPHILYSDLRKPACSASRNPSFLIQLHGKPLIQLFYGAYSAS